MRKLLFLTALIALPVTSSAEISISVQDGITGLTSNSVIDIAHDSVSVWAGTGGGAAVTFDEGDTWITYGGGHGLPGDEVSALAANNRGVWVANSRSETVSGERIPIGQGISLTVDDGQNWQNFDPRQATWYGMLSYDLAVYDSLAFSACFYGGLIRSTDYGSTWENLFPSQLDTINVDSVDFNNGAFSRLTNRFFSVQVDTSAFPDTFSVWGGSAAGITHFYFLRDMTDQTFHTYPDSIYHITREDTTVADSVKLPGDFVVALGVQEMNFERRIWAACRPAFSGYLRVAYSADDGLTWHEAAIGGLSNSVEGWDFAFKKDTVLVATGEGLFWSSGDYSYWTLQTGFRDIADQTFYQDNAPFYAVDIVNGVIWGGGSDGVVKSLPSGGWDVYRSERDPDDHYAYPSPFSPIQSTRQGTTIHFKPSADTRATVTVYDINLERVKTVVSRIFRRGGVESDDVVWDGTNDDGDLVANGVYFYRVEMDSGDDLWGKVVVIK
jgi:hypothetical protein